MKNMKTLRKIKRSGSILALAICILAILIVLGVGFLSLGLNSRLVAIHDASVIVARSAADSGLTQVMHQMTAQLSETPPSVDGISLPATPEILPGFDAANPATYAAQSSTASPTGTRWYSRAESTGYYNQAARKVVARLVVQSRFYASVYTKEDITLDNSALIGCSGGLIGTNSKERRAVNIKNNAVVDGTVWVGPDGEPAEVIDYMPGGTITGDKSAASEPYPFDPAIDFMPNDLKTAENKGNIIIAPADVNTPLIIDSSIVGQFVKYNYINVSNGGTIKIYPPAAGDPVTSQMYIYILGQIDMGTFSEVHIITANPYAKVNLFVGGNISVNNSGPVNCRDENGQPASLDPAKLKIWGLSTCQKIEMNVGGQFYTDIYAPDADVLLRNGFPLVGSVIAKSFTSKEGSSLTCMLPDGSPFDIGAFFVIDRWWEGAAGETPPDIMP